MGEVLEAFSLELFQAIPMEKLHTMGFVYRLWDAAGQCIYVGQTKRRPAIRIAQHQDRPWWSDVVRADYIEVPLSDLRAEESRQIEYLAPRETIRPGCLGGEALPIRSIRISDDMWDAFGDAVQREWSAAMRNRSAVLRLFLDAYIAYPGNFHAMMRDLNDVTDIRAALQGMSRKTREARKI